MVAKTRAHFVVLSTFAVFLIRLTCVVTKRERTFRVGIIFDQTVLPGEIYHLVDNVAGKYNSDTNNSSNITIQLPRLRLNTCSDACGYTAVETFLGEDLNGVISILECRQTRIVSGLTVARQLPHVVSGSVRRCGPLGPYTLHLGRDSAVQTQLFKALLAVAGLESIGLVFDNSVESELRNRLLFALPDLGVLTSPAVLSSDKHKVGELRKALVEMPKKIVVITESISNLKTIFKQVRQLGMTSLQYFWLIITNDITLEEAASLLGPSSSGNQVLVKPHITPCPCCSDSLRQSVCGNLTQSELSLMESRLVESICLFYCAFDQHIQDNSTQSQQPGSACTTSMCSVEESLRLKLLERKSVIDVIEIRNFPQKLTRVVGKWTESTGLEMRDDGKVFGKIDDFGRRVLTVAVDPESAPYTSRPDGGTVDEYKGLVIDILSELADSLNFTYKLVESPDGYYGSPGEDGSWNGMIGMVLRGEADMAVGPFTVTHQRDEVIEFTTAFMQQSVGILTPTPGKSSQLFQFLKPFSLSVWLVIAAFIAVSGFCMYMINYMTHPTLKSNDVKNRPKDVKLLENIVLVVSSIFGQGPTFHPTVLSARCLLGVWLLFTELLLSMYTAHLAAVLTVALPIKPIESLQELDSRDDMTILVQEATSTWTLFEHSKLELYQRINSKKIGVPSTDEGIHLVKQGGHCYIGGRVSLQFYVAESCGEIRLAEERFFSSSYAFVLPKHSPYKDPINFRILKLLEFGIVESLRESWLNPSPQCASKSSPDRDLLSLDIDTLGGVFVVYGAAIVLGLVVLLVEHLWLRSSPRDHRPASQHGESCQVATCMGCLGDKS